MEERTAEATDTAERGETARTAGSAEVYEPPALTAAGGFGAATLGPIWGNRFDGFRYFLG